jgi:hypothetical protein
MAFWYWNFINLEKIKKQVHKSNFKTTDKN